MSQNVVSLPDTPENSDGLTLRQRKILEFITATTADRGYPPTVREIADAIRKADGFFAVDVIAADTYKGIGAVKTLAVGAQWVTSDKADANTVYEIVKALYSDAGQKAMGAGHAKGKFITKENAVQGAGIPFHPGAAKFYKEVGVLK